MKKNLFYLALFNISDKKSMDISVDVKDLGLKGVVKVMNMWTGEYMGTVSDKFSQSVGPHASGLYKLVNL